MGLPVVFFLGSFWDILLSLNKITVTTHFESPLKMVISSMSRFSLFIADIIAFLSKKTFNNTGEKLIIHFMDFPVIFATYYFGYHNQRVDQKWDFHVI